jgi:hypothetical protein
MLSKTSEPRRVFPIRDRPGPHTRIKKARKNPSSNDTPKGGGTCRGITGENGSSSRKRLTIRLKRRRFRPVRADRGLANSSGGEAPGHYGDHHRQVNNVDRQAARIDSPRRPTELPISALGNVVDAGSSRRWRVCSTVGEGWGEGCVVGCWPSPCRPRGVWGAPQAGCPNLSSLSHEMYIKFRFALDASHKKFPAKNQRGSLVALIEMFPCCFSEMRFGLGTRWLWRQRKTPRGAGVVRCIGFASGVTLRGRLTQWPLPSNPRRER